MCVWEGISISAGWTVREKLRGTDCTKAVHESDQSGSETFKTIGQEHQMNIYKASEGRL